MALSGYAKTEYMREYMRRVRAGLPGAQPKPAASPRQRAPEPEAATPPPATDASVAAPEGWDVAAALKVWFEAASEDDREDFLCGLSTSDLDTLLMAVASNEGFSSRGGGYVDWLYSVGVLENSGYVKLPPGVSEYALDKLLRETYGKGLDEEY